MGRELKRVPIDFKWSIGQLWKGYINPYRSMECKSCERTGLNPATKKLNDDWYAFDKDDDWVYPEGTKGRRWNNAAWSNHITDIEVKALVTGGRLNDLMDKWYRYDEDKSKWFYLNEEQDKPRNEWQWVECAEPKMPTAEQVNEWNRKGHGHGHDAINRWICVNTRAKHLGVYGHCEYCEEGEIWQSEEIKKLSAEWQRFDPPTGDGFQLWSTTTEGHPMSPVFKTLNELCDYLEKEKVSVFGSSTWTKEEWYKSLSGGNVYYQEGNAIFI